MLRARRMAVGRKEEKGETEDEKEEGEGKKRCV